MPMAQERKREIIDDFAKEIQERKIEASPAESTRIDFRNGIVDNREETVYKVPLDLLRLRKENGRISSSVKTYERVTGRLDRADSSAQLVLQGFLRDKDPERTDELKLLLRAEGQREPGIITADGFLINGNRRKVALSELRDEFPGEDGFQTMKVVILPGKGDEGGPPTLKEIEQIENRYQLQTEGKAEYYGFDAALSIRDKENSGYTLDQQMRDDPQYKLMGRTEFSRVVTKRRKELLEPLECIEEYLEAIRRPGEYSAISRGLGDPEGRWQAFIDLSSGFSRRAKTNQGLQKMGIDAKEAGKVMQAAYAVIRMRDIPNFGKLHNIMRALPKYTQHGKEHLLEISRNTEHDLPEEEITNENGKPLPQEAIEKKWKSKYASEITRDLIKARSACEFGEETNAPMALLSNALSKLNHKDMIVENIETSDLKDALRQINKIKDRSEELKKEIYGRVKKSGRK